jgi:hypothetical protein
MAPAKRCETKFLRTVFVPILLATVWIALSEFVRNQFLLKSYWIKHYESLGLIFPSKPINGALWGVWSLAFAIAIFIISRRFSFLQTALLSWFSGFVLMWIAIENLGVLPRGLMLIAVPLSLIEAFLASLIVMKFPNRKENGP